MSDTQNNDSLLRLEQIIGSKIKNIDGLLPQGKSTFYKAIAKGLYPAPIKHGGVSFWRRSEIEAIVAGGSI